MVSGRAALPLLFGLRYALIFHTSDLRACMDAFCLMQLLEHAFKVTSVTLGHKDLFSDVSTTMWMFYVAVRAVDGKIFPQELSRQLERLVPIALLVLVNCLTFRLSEIFASIGGYIHRRAEEKIASNASNGEHSPVAAGLIVLAVYTCSLTIIATF
jgi:hypothetical protein